MVSKRDLRWIDKQGKFQNVVNELEKVNVKVQDLSEGYSSLVIDLDQVKKDYLPKSGGTLTGDLNAKKLTSTDGSFDKLNITNSSLSSKQSYVVVASGSQLYKQNLNDFMSNAGDPFTKVGISSSSTKIQLEKQNLKSTTWETIFATGSNLSFDITDVTNPVLNYNDSHLAKLTGNNTFSGNNTFKGSNTFSGNNTFTNEIVKSQPNGYSGFRVSNTGYQRGTIPTSTTGLGRFIIYDKDGQYLAYLQAQVNTEGMVSFSLLARQTTSAGGSSWNTMGLSLRATPTGTSAEFTGGSVMVPDVTIS